MFLHVLKGNKECNSENYIWSVSKHTGLNNKIPPHTTKGKNILHRKGKKEMRSSNAPDNIPKLFHGVNLTYQMLKS